jgi:hypothetical protein
MAHNIVKTGNRQWIAKTYVHGQALQDWVDAHPEAQSEDDLAQGLESVMNSWTDAQLGALSFHLSGAAFDLAPVAGDQGDAIKAAINVLPNLNKFIDGESGVNVWHLQFDE